MLEGLIGPGLALRVEVLLLALPCPHDLGLIGPGLALRVEVLRLALTTSVTMTLYMYGAHKGKGLDTCYSAAYVVRLATSSALQSRK